jgi:hypothetical protein
LVVLYDRVCSFRILWFRSAEGVVSLLFECVGVVWRWQLDFLVRVVAVNTKLRGLALPALEAGATRRGLGGRKVSGLRVHGPRRGIERVWLERERVEKRMRVWISYLVNHGAVCTSVFECGGHIAKSLETGSMEDASDANDHGSAQVHHDRSAHAERVAIQFVMRATGVRRLLSRGLFVLYSMHTPCTMCLFAVCECVGSFVMITGLVIFDRWEAPFIFQLLEG